MNLSPKIIHTLTYTATGTLWEHYFNLCFLNIKKFPIPNFSDVFASDFYQPSLQYL